MPKTDYVPRTDDALLIWHDQFKTTVTANITTFGLAAGDATQVNADNTDIHAKIATATSTAAIAKQATADKNTSRATLEKHARALANRIKAHPASTAAAIPKRPPAKKNPSPPPLKKHARALANRIKAHPAYTAAYGELLG